MDGDLRFRVVGAGRAGRSFAAALESTGARCAGLLDLGDDLAPAGDGVELVIVAVPDDVIDEVAGAIDPFDGVVLHVSGATGLEALDGHARTGSIHPLVSLPDPTIGAGRLLAGATFAVAGDRLATDIAERLGGTAISVPDDQRPLYHATAVVAANHVVVLCAQVERLAAEVGVPVEAYWELMDRTLENVRSQGAVAALTGPAARGDVATVQAHLRALDDEERALYAALARGAAVLADQADPTGPDGAGPPPP